MEIRKTSNGEVEVRCALSDIRIEEREGESGGRSVTGYAAKFETWSSPIHGWFIENIRSGAFEGCDMGDTIMTFNHNVDDILARASSGTLTLEVDATGLRFNFDAPNTTRGNDMVELRRGDVNKCSFRFIVEKDEWLYADEQNGLKHDQRTILKVAKLYDVALVVYPAYQDTEASVRHLEQRKADYLESLRTEQQPEGNGADTDAGDTPPEEQLDKDVATATTDAASEGRDCLQAMPSREEEDFSQCLSRDRLVTVMKLVNK